MTEPQVRVLGPIQLIVDDRPVGLGATMLRAVLARLVAAGGRSAGTDRLIDDLWEGNPPPTAASVLQVHIHNLRRLIEPDRPRRARSQYLVSESSGYALKLAPESVDAWQFEALMRSYEQRLRAPGGLPDPVERRNALDAALRCWNGAAFEGLTTFGWAAQDADRLTDLRLTAAEMRAAVELDLNRPTEVTIELRTLLDEHPEREEIARLLATAQYRIGQQAQALSTLRHSREFLGEHYGIDPSPALRELEAAILSHSETLAGAEAPAGPAPAIRIRRTREHSGYVREHTVLRETAAIAATGRLQMVWIAGEAGAGKTTLTESALADLGAESPTFLRGGCPEVDGAPPAWAWAEVLNALDPVASENLAAGDAFTIARTVVSLCKQRSAAGPVVILIEDAHRADTATLQVLRQVVNWLRDEPVLMVVTLRGSEAGQGLHATAAALTHCTAEWLELGGLDLAATRTLALSSGLREISKEALELLHRRTGGNPLFVREMAKLIAAQHGSGETGEVPDSIRELITTRLRRLSPEVGSALAHLAIWGDGVDLRVLSQAAGISEDEVIDLIAEAEAATLVRTDRTGRITFDHALIHDTVYLGIPRLRRMRLHWAALELLDGRVEDFPGLARDPETLARHAALGARPETAVRAIEYVMAAARHDTDRGMAADTVRLWKSVIELHELAGHNTVHAEREVRAAVIEAHLALVNALAYQCRWFEARDIRDRAMELAQAFGDQQLLVRTLTCWRAPIMYPALQGFDPRERLARAVDSCLAGEIDNADRVRLLVTAAIETAGDYRDSGLSHRYAVAALTQARVCDDPELLCAAINAVALVRFTSGEDLALVQELLEVAERAELDQYRALGHYGLFRCALGRVDLPEACRQAELALGVVTDALLPQLILMLGCIAAPFALLRGDIDGADRLYTEFDERLAQLGFLRSGGPRSAIALSQAWASGDLAGLQEQMHEVYTQAPGYGGPFYALALLAAGQHDRAEELYREFTPIRPTLFPQAEYGIRAYVALGLGLTEDFESLYRQLAPYAGTFLGLEGTGAVCGTTDTVLAMLAMSQGDFERAATHQENSERLTNRTRTELADLQPPRLDPMSYRRRTTVVAH
ncbi:BTAD domain-containing putative transcriptional regulator [Nocardia sp. NPDC006630]|uniref:BTAD domain-containing putative transcriptional regulator n=1 Tax=Nocardia sp. NPDC006630 TaxID=3157181 RepID=UPI0033A23E6B